jgi:hypothetical protein
MGEALNRAYEYERINRDILSKVESGKKVKLVDYENFKQK